MPRARMLQKVQQITRLSVVCEQITALMRGLL